MSDVLFANGGEGVWGISQVGDGLGVGGGISMHRSSLANSPNLEINSMFLTAPTASYTTSSPSTSTSAALPTSSPSINGRVYTLTLPSLLSLKVIFDNATFTTLSKSDMPRLTHLSVVSAEFGYAAEGFHSLQGVWVGNLAVGVGTKQRGLRRGVVDVSAFTYPSQRSWILQWPLFNSAG